MRRQSKLLFGAVAKVIVLQLGMMEKKISTYGRTSLTMPGMETKYL